MSSSIKPGLGQWLSYLALRVLLRVISWLPLSVSRKLGAALGYGYYKLFRKRVDYARINLRICFPHLSNDEREALVKRSLQHSGMWFFETAAIWQWPREKVLKYVTVANPELLEQALNNNHGVLLAIPHLGNWEIISPLLSHQHDFACFYQHNAKQPLISRFIYRARARHGATLAPADASGVRLLYRQLKAGKIAGLLPDHIPSEQMGVYAPFFGRQALTGTLISSLARKNQVPVLTAAITRHSRGFEVRFAEVADQQHDDPVVAATALNLALEQAICLAPEQFQWVYPRFRKQQPGSQTRSPYRMPLAALD